MPSAWAQELDRALNARVGGPMSAFVTPQITEPVSVHYTRGAIGLDIQWDAASLPRSVDAFMDALGGETRPDAEAERAFAAARASRTRPAAVVRRRSEPPRPRNSAA